MDTTLFLVQFWGWLMLIFGVVFLFKKPSSLMELFRLAEDKAFVAASGFLSVVVGLLTVLLHNVWASDWTVIITIAGWVSLVKGVIRIGFPRWVSQMAVKMENRSGLVRVSLVVMIVLGAWLLWAASQIA